MLWLGGGQGMSQAELLDERNLQQIARVNPEEARRLELRSGDFVRDAPPRIARAAAGRRHRAGQRMARQTSCTAARSSSS